MELTELFLYRKQILDESSDQDGYTTDAGFLECCLPWLNETKHTESTDITHIYDPLENGTIKVDAFMCNESGERLQLFLVNEISLNPEATEEELMISQKSIYEKQFNRSILFVKKSVKKQIHDLLQDGSPSWMLAHQLETADFLDQIDVIELFLLSATATIESRGIKPSAKMLEFDDETISVSFVYQNQKISKDIIVIKRLIDLNFLYNIHIAHGSRYPLVIDFKSAPFECLLPYLHAAGEKDYDSYLCALPASLLAELYKRYSSRLLEKNVRSFLQLKGVNRGMQDTIRKEPEKFIAYNNGLTITATACEVENQNGVSYLKSLSDFQIVNGGQTTATLFFSKKSGLNIDSVKVMAKINVVRDATEETLDELISNISTFSNAQSKVSKVDLRARSPQLVKIKSLSESVLSVSGKKWFFERVKGEYATMLRINPAKKTQIEKAFPKERKFTKEDLAKYYCAWGDKPYAVKKGGEKIFRFFLEEISGEGKTKLKTTINRSFYEDLIARIILFRSLEKIYGSGVNSLGQLRSAVVPYSISVLFLFYTGKKCDAPFDLIKIWKAEKLENDLQQFFTELMILMNELIKSNSQSDDVGEYAKNPRLWEDISSAKEIETFMLKNKKVIQKYTISSDELKKREKEAIKSESLDFEPLVDAALIYDRGTEFYKTILSSFGDQLSSSKVNKIHTIISSIYKNEMPDYYNIQYEKELIKSISVNHPGLLKSQNTSSLFTQTVNLIIRKYNSAISNGKSIEGSFSALKEIAGKKKIPFYSVFGEIGRSLENSEIPTMQQIKHASEYCKILSQDV